MNVWKKCILLAILIAYLVECARNAKYLLSCTRRSRVSFRTIFWQIVMKSRRPQNIHESSIEENATLAESDMSFTEQLVFGIDAANSVNECSAVITDLPPKASHLKLDDWRMHNLHIVEEIDHGDKTPASTVSGPLARVRKLVVSAFRRQSSGKKKDSYDVFSEIDF